MKTTFRLLLLVFLAPLAMRIPLCAQWVQSNGLSSGDIRALAVSGTNFFAATFDGVFLSTDNGTSWTPSGLIGDISTRSFAVSGTNLFAGTDGGGVFLSTNNGISWTAVNSGLANMYILSFAVSGTNLFAATDSGVYLSTNSGTSWTAANSGLSNTVVRSFAVSSDSPGNLFAGTFGSGVFLSTNNGTSWTAVNSGLMNAIVYALAVTPDSSGNLYAGTFGGVYLSTNNGTTWTPSGLFGDASILSFAVSGTSLFAGTDGGGVFLSTNNSTSWTAVNTGLTNTFVWSLAVSGTNLFAGTYGGGVWRRPLSEIITAVERLSTDLPTHFILSQNYPNPFNPATTISFSLPSNSFVSLKVFDALGREVGVLVSEELAAGKYARQWSAEGLPSGIYFYRMQAGSFNETKKLILLR